MMLREKTEAVDGMDWLEANVGLQWILDEGGHGLERSDASQTWMRAEDML